jgi:hypothetical protein
VSIPLNHAWRHVYHFTHIDNLPGLLKHGFLANNHPKFPKRNHRSIAAAGIQERRAKMAVPCEPGGYIHDYVPLYFGSRSPMLLGVIQSKNVDQPDILYFEFPIALAERPDVVFTDASANTIDPPGFYADAADLAKLDWTAIDSLKWGNINDAFRHRRMAELLVHSNLPVTAAARCVVWGEDAKKRVEKIVNGAPFPPITFEHKDRHHYFTDFANGRQSSLVLGPREIARAFSATCKAIEENCNQHSNIATFANLAKLLEGLRANFGSLPHTAELVGLRSANGFHKRTVDVHTKEVVAQLLKLPEYQALDNKPKALVEIAAYLHDIGKGPRSRWNANGGFQKVDSNHPVGAMPMIVEIMTQHVAKLSQGAAETVTKLVCYHDLVGDVLGRARDERQIVEVANDKEELDMLFALGKADATVLIEHWWDEDAADALYERCLTAIEEDSEE